MTEEVRGSVTEEARGDGEGDRRDERGAGAAGWGGVKGAGVAEWTHANFLRGLWHNTGEAKPAMDPARAEMVTLWAAQEPRLRRYLRRAAGLREADDLVHQTFIEATRSWGRFDRRGSRAAWLFGIARNVARRAVRQARRRRMEPLEAEPAARADGTSASALEGAAQSEAASESADRVERMREAIAGLPDHLRETLVLRLACEMTYEEIASVLEIPIGTVRSRLHEAVRRLRERLTQDES